MAGKKQEYTMNDDFFRVKKSVARMTFRQASEIMGMSQQRLCQTEQSAIRKMVEGLIDRGMDDLEAIMAVKNLFGFRGFNEVLDVLDDGHIIRLKLKYMDTIR